MTDIKWTWVKAHAGYLLNECADMLATKGVRNETPAVNVQFLHPINEDTDPTEYTFKEGETVDPPSNWTGDTMPPEDHLCPSFRVNQENSPAVVALPESSPYSVMLSDSEETTDDEPQFPQPVSTPDSENEDRKGPAQLFPTIVSLPTAPIEPVRVERPQWWTEAWNMLDGIESEDPRIGYVVPVEGRCFEPKCESDCHAIDRYCSRFAVDAVTGETRNATREDDQQQVVCGAMWTDEVITLSATCGKGCDPDERYLHHLKMLLSAVPNGRALTLHTSSEFLFQEGEKFRQWVQSGRISEVWDQMHSAWKNILGHLEDQGKLMAIIMHEPGEFPQQMAALEKHCQERIEKEEEYERGGRPENDPTEPSWI
jgi:hypothetical protein